MTFRRTAFALLASACFVPLLAGAEIYRCQSSNGTAYQQLPCGEEAPGGLAGIASEYPPANLAERDRLFQREEAMYKRLEAQRERLSQESRVRSALVAAAPAEDAQVTPVFVAMQPVRRWHRAQPYRGILQR
jgi:hypothetical protein